MGDMQSFLNIEWWNPELLWLQYYIWGPRIGMVQFWDPDRIGALPCLPQFYGWENRVWIKQWFPLNSHKKLVLKPMSFDSLFLSQHFKSIVINMIIIIIVVIVFIIVNKLLLLKCQALLLAVYLIKYYYLIFMTYYSSILQMRGLRHRI